MATEESDKPGRQPIPPAKRRRLQQCFEHGSKMNAAGNFDYATEMYTQCVTGDPANPIYVKSFLANLQKKYNNNKSGSKMASVKGMGIKGSLKKASMQKDYSALITTGLEMLKLNPWDTTTLTEMARACEELEYDECQLEYLRMAQDADMKDPEVNRAFGRALGRLGNFDEAIACWQRVNLAKPGDEEAVREIGNLTVEKTIKKGGYDTAESSTDVRAKKGLISTEEETGDKRLSPQQQLERAIAKNPADVNKYVELVELHLRDEHFDKAEEVLTRALAASGGEVGIREKLEDVQLRRARQSLIIAEKKAREEKTEASINLYNQIKAELNNKELQVYSNRCDRYPTNLGFKYELAVRLQKAKKYTEAIKLFQEARSDLKRKGQVFMALGQCFAAIKQYKLSLTNFEAAVTEIPEREIDMKKEALYLAGKLAVHLKDLDTGDKHLSALASLDFGYKDVSEWLDKLAKLREDGVESLDD
jgi:tetratricopeptide (TPR) repeat protein